MRVKRLLLCLIFAALAALLMLRVRESDKRREDGGAPPAKVFAPPLPVWQQALEQAFQKAKEDPALAGATVGFCLLDAGGKVLFEQNGHASMIPASTLKTVTTATALEKWGPDHRLETRLLAKAQAQGGVIAGDVVVRGGGDPMLALEDLAVWAGKLHAEGVRKITGRIIGDGSLFPGSLYGDFWGWGDIGNGYGSGVAGLNLEHNRCGVKFDAGTAEGDAAVFAGAEPEVPGVVWINETKTGAEGSGDGIMIHGGERTGRLFLRGTVPLGARGFAVQGAVPDPELYAAHHLKLALVRVGIAVDGEAITAAFLREKGEALPVHDEVLLKHESPRLIEIITSIHATSDNHETDCLYHWLGVGGSDGPAGVIREHWQERGLVFSGLRMVDGCGLSRADFIRPLDLALLQQKAASGPQGALYKESLLASRDGSVRWKGGAMSAVRSYTGLVSTASGEELAFALMVNHFGGSQPVGALRDAVLEAVKKR